MNPVIWLTIACTIAVISGATPVLAQDLDIGITNITHEQCTDCEYAGYSKVTITASVQNIDYSSDRDYNHDIYLEYARFLLGYTAPVNCTYDSSQTINDGKHVEHLWTNCTTQGTNEPPNEIYTADGGDGDCNAVKPTCTPHSSTKRVFSDCSLTGTIQRGETREVTTCFTVPASAEYTILGVYGDRRDRVAYHVTLDGAECSSSHCVDEIDLTRVGDATYEYTVTDTSIYNSVHPGYSDIINQAIKDGLDKWADMNPHIRFMHINDNNNEADFHISMGGTGESSSFSDNTDTYGRVNDVGCLVEADAGCELKLYVENNNHDGTVDLMNSAMIEYVTAHETGHLLGLPHHPSALHVMHNTYDTDVDWYNDEYGFTAPALKAPVIRTLEAEGSYTQLRDVWEQIYPSVGATENEVKLGTIIIGLLNLLG